jgi:4-diphosphocytidyl-2-C-methyl-D-erythritol kinase
MSGNGGPSHTLVVEARAKVNPFLRVLGRRPDGYHDLETLVLPVSLSDRLRIHAVADAVEFRTLSLSLEIHGEASLVEAVPRDESNLVLRAAAVLAEAAGVRGFADIDLEKRIPAAAGLGGGSADAAATLRALNDLWECGLEADRLREMASGVGSDVPALLHEGAVVARGRGNVVDPVRVGPLRWGIVLLPFGVSTGDAFGWWDRDGAPTGPDPEALIRAAGSGDPSGVGPLLFNDLEEPVIRRHPEIGLAKERLKAAGATGAVMCGSGSSVAGLFPAGVELPNAEFLEAWSGPRAGS